jgi:hypothetical protein
MVFNNANFNRQKGSIDFPFYGFAIYLLSTCLNQKLNNYQNLPYPGRPAGPGGRRIRQLLITSGVTPQI